MNPFLEYLSGIENPQHRLKMEGVLAWILQKFPALNPKVAWNQPMFSDHGTYIIGFSAAKNHFSVAPEKAGVLRFSREIAQAGYEQTELLFRIKWDHPVNFALLEDIINYNILEKTNCLTFWR